MDPHDPVVNFLLRGLATHAMVQALYFSTGSAAPEEWAHYGLALDRYTHFTSPIRRYADVVVHRLLLLALQAQDWWSGEGGKTSATSATMGSAELQELSAHINERNRAAQLAQRASQTLFQTLFFRGRAPDDPRCVADAVVFAVRANGVLVYVPRYALKGPVYLQQAEGGEVLWYKPDFGPVWREGKVVADVGELRVEVDGGKKKQVNRKLFLETGIWLGKNISSFFCL